MTASMFNRQWQTGNYRVVGRSESAPSEAKPVSDPAELREPLIAAENSIPLSAVALISTDQFDVLIKQGHWDFKSQIFSNPGVEIQNSYVVSYDYLNRFAYRPELIPGKNKVSIIGLGNVGSSILQALTLLPIPMSGISEIHIFDPDKHLLERWLLECNHIASLNISNPGVFSANEDTVFNADTVLFCAAASVPDAGKEGKEDIRLKQFSANVKLLKPYLDKAIALRYPGIIAIVSDPVDHLTRFAVEYCSGKLAPAQFVGLGLGVMYARAKHLLGTDNDENLWVCGTHGDRLQVINDIFEYDPGISSDLTQKTQTANLRIRDTGFKPYVGPALSSGVLSLIAMLNQQPFWGAIWNGKVVWGSKIIYRNHSWGWYPLGHDKRIRDLLMSNMEDIDTQYKQLTSKS